MKNNKLASTQRETLGTEVRGGAPLASKASLTMGNDDRIYRVEGWGLVGDAMMYAFVPFPGFKHPRDLDIGESTEGAYQNPTSDKKPERITRVK